MPFNDYVKRQLNARKVILSHPNKVSYNASSGLYPGATSSPKPSRLAFSATFHQTRNVDGNPILLNTEELIDDWNKNNPEDPVESYSIDPTAFWAYTTEKTCTLTMASGVDMKNDGYGLIGDGGLFDNNSEAAMDGEDLAFRWILESGVRQGNYLHTMTTEERTKHAMMMGYDPNATSIKDRDESIDVWARMNGHWIPKQEVRGRPRDLSGVGKMGAYGNQEYRGDPGDGFGMVPMPGIIDAEVRTKSDDGSLREARVNFRCHNRRQLEVLEMLYMRPGHFIMLEWGWNPYISNKFKREMNRFSSLGTFFEANNIIDDINNEIRKNKELSGGNYDGFIGYCKNFHWKAREDGGYDCTTEIIAQGEILESLKSQKVVLDVSDRMINHADGLKEPDIEITDKFLYYLESIRHCLNSAGDKAFYKYFGTTNHIVINYREDFYDKSFWNDAGVPEFGITIFKNSTGSHRFSSSEDLYTWWKRGYNNPTSFKLQIPNNNNNNGRFWTAKNRDRGFVEELLKKYYGYEDWQIQRVFDMFEKGHWTEEIIFDPETDEIFYIDDLNKKNSYYRDGFNEVLAIAKKIAKQDPDRVKRYDTANVLTDFEGTHFNETSKEDGYDLRGQGFDILAGGLIGRQVVRFDAKEAPWTWTNERGNTKEMLDERWEPLGGMEITSKDHVQSDSGYRKHLFLRWDFVCQILNLLCTDRYRKDEPVVKFEYLIQNQKSYDPRSNGLRSPLTDEFKNPQSLIYIPYAMPSLQTEDRILFPDGSTFSNHLGQSYDERVCLMPHQPMLFNIVPSNEEAVKYNPPLSIDPNMLDYMQLGDKGKQHARVNKNEDTDWAHLTDYHDSVWLGGEDYGKNYKPSVQAGHNSIGYIMLNLDMLISQYRSMRLEKVETEEGSAQVERLNKDFSMFDYVKSIWDSVNDATANYYNFQIQTEHERPNFVRIIDRTLSGTEHISKNDLYEFDPQGLASITRDFYFDSQISNDMASMVSIAAQSPASIYDLNAMSFKKFSEGIMSRFTSWQYSEEEIASQNQQAYDQLEKDVERYKNIMIKLQVFLYKFNNSYFAQSPHVRWDGVRYTGATISPSVAKLYAHELQELEHSIHQRHPLEDKNGNKNDGEDGRPYGGTPRPGTTLHRSAVIPIQSNLKMDGISGIIPLNLYRINKDKLPYGYQEEDIAFIVKTETQKITSGQDWTTEITGQLVLLNTNKNDTGVNPVVEEKGKVIVKKKEVTKDKEKIEWINPWDPEGLRSDGSEIKLGSNFGRRKGRGDLHGKPHAGLDIPMALGTSILAPRSGRILNSTENPWMEKWSTGYGNYVCMEFDDPYEKLIHTYNEDNSNASSSTHSDYQGREPGKPVARACFAHLDRIDVDYDQHVKQGEQIGTCGGTGHKGRFTYGVHLHYEIGTEDHMNKIWRDGVGGTSDDRKIFRMEYASIDPQYVVNDVWKSL